MLMRAAASDSSVDPVQLGGARNGHDPWLLREDPRKRDPPCRRRQGRHTRPAYRIAHAVPSAVAVVVSQDGGVRFVCDREDRVTYWEQQ